MFLGFLSTPDVCALALACLLRTRKGCPATTKRYLTDEAPGLRFGSFHVCELSGKYGFAKI